MKRFTHLRWIAAAASTGLLLALAACGGGPSSSGLVGGGSPPALTITTTSLPPGDVDQSYSATLQATGGTGTRTWSLASGSGSLPDDLTLNSSGVISGTPTAEGTFNFTVQVADSGSPQQVATRALSILIRTDALTITTTALPNGQVGVAYSQFVSATNGQPPFFWSISVGPLPAGLTIDSNTGEIGGLP
ncbi:MAG: Ig domain-containing protein, partial [Candidatus Acidoferrales bacterium]